LAIYFEEILSYIVLNIFCGYFISPKGPNWEVIYIIPIFGIIFLSKNGHLTPRGDPILDYMGEITKIRSEIDYLPPK
jgi:hypothetical protein